MKNEESSLGKIYFNIYNKICGTHPNLYLWHFQWLAVKDLYSDLKQILPTIEGRILDVGCGDKPYQVWLNLEKVEHIGLDVYPGSQVDIVIKSDESWSMETSSFDAILCTQVLEHTAKLDNILLEISRVLRVGGVAIIAVPFIYNQHGTDDYRRLSIYGMKNLLENQYEIIDIKTQGGLGSTIGILLLNWIEMQMNLYKSTRLLKGTLLPVWIVFCLLINTIGWLVDCVDKTQSFYSNTWVVVRKRCV
jgi:SAM-dependent methyltransferase